MARALFGAEAAELERRGLAPCRCAELAELEALHPREPTPELVQGECIGCHRQISIVNGVCLGCAFWGDAGRVPTCAKCGKLLERGPIGGGHFDYLTCKCEAP